MIDCNLKRNRNKKVCNARRSVGEAEFSLILPKNDNSGRKINNKNHFEYIKKMNNRFGGSTTNPKALGCFKSEKTGKIECEENIQINAVRDFDNPFEDSTKKLTLIEKEQKLQDDFKFMKKLGTQATKDFGQEGIFVKFDRIEDAKFILGKRKEELSSEKIFNDVFNREI